MKFRLLSACGFGRFSAGFAISVTLPAISAFACVQGYELPPMKSLLPSDIFNVAQPEPIPLPTLELLKKQDLLLAIAPPRGSKTGEKSPAAQAAHEDDGHVALVRAFEARPPGSTSFAEVTNYTVALVHLGKYERAIEVLLALEKERPGVYSTAANLGTAYELSGNNLEALRWIGEGIARDSDSHRGTEWLHLAILQAKIKLASDPSWLRRHSVLDVTPERRSADDILLAIEYQLNERLHFVQPADPTVCDLFYQAALLVKGEPAAKKREYFLRESLRFGDWRKAEVAALQKS